MVDDDAFFYPAAKASLDTRSRPLFYSTRVFPSQRISCVLCFLPPIPMPRCLSPLLELLSRSAVLCALSFVAPILGCRKWCTPRPNAGEHSPAHPVFSLSFFGARPQINVIARLSSIRIVRWTAEVCTKKKKPKRTRAQWMELCCIRSFTKHDKQNW